MKIFLVIFVFYIIFGEARALTEYIMKEEFPSIDTLVTNDELEKNRIAPHSSMATIVKQEFTKFKDGGYRFYYETSEGQSREEVGFFRIDPKLGKILNVHGSYGYIGPSKKKVFVKYVSDERGFRYENSAFPPVGLPSNIINQHLGIFNL